MIIDCPCCGARPADEFVCRGDARLSRPNPETADRSAWVGYVYLRDNPKGRLDEYWHHAGGCRSWLIVTRDTATHAVYGVRFAAVGQGAAS